MSKKQKEQEGALSLFPFSLQTSQNIPYHDSPMHKYIYQKLTIPSQIDPKRAIPRDEQEKTSKIFVGGVSQEATEQDFKQFFTQFGRVIDATLMIDKDTGRPRGFGFVTFDSEAAVENALSRPLEILGKPIEVKKAQPRGNLRDENRGGRGGRDNYRDMNQGGDSGPHHGGGGAGGGAGGQQGMAGGMTPQMMAQYWQRMQQYFAMMQQQMAMGGGNMNMGAMNPAMIQQMQQMQMKQMAAQMGGAAGPQQQQQPGGAGGMSPNPASPGAQQQQGMPMMNPAMMQGQPQGGQQGPGGPSAGNGSASPGAGYNRQQPGGPGYNAQEQIAFEQQKYEQQQARHVMDPSRGYSPYQQGGPTSWEGMYDEVPQPNIPTGPQGMVRGGSMGRGMPSLPWS
jgi:RNA-binding protein Musashi